jgi:hypothetical protein
MGHQAVCHVAQCPQVRVFSEQPVWWLSDWNWVQNHREHLTVPGAANVDSMSWLCILAKQAIVMFSMDGLIPFLMPFSFWATDCFRARQEFWTLWTLDCPCEVTHPSPQSLLDNSTPIMRLPVCVVLAGYSLDNIHLFIYFVLGRRTAMQCTLSVLSLKWVSVLPMILPCSE